MKKAKAALIAVIFSFIFVLSACSPDYGKMLVGVWSLENENFSVVATFNKDGTGQIEIENIGYENTSTVAGSWSVENDILKLKPDREEELAEADLKILALKGNRITVMFDHDYYYDYWKGYDSNFYEEASVYEFIKIK